MTSQQRKNDQSARVLTNGPATEFFDRDCRVTLVPLTFAKRGVQVKLIAPNKAIEANTKPAIDVPLLRAVGLAFQWAKELREGKADSAADLATQKELDKTWVNETLRFTLLAPDIIEAIYRGTQPRTLSLQTIRQHVPPEWEEQRRLWGFGAST